MADLSDGYGGFLVVWEGRRAERGGFHCFGWRAIPSSPVRKSAKDWLLTTDTDGDSLLHMESESWRCRIPASIFDRSAHRLSDQRKSARGDR